MSPKSRRKGTNVARTEHSHYIKTNTSILCKVKGVFVDYLTIEMMNLTNSQQKSIIRRRREPHNQQRWTTTTTTRTTNQTSMIVISPFVVVVVLFVFCLQQIPNRHCSYHNSHYGHSMYTLHLVSAFTTTTSLRSSQLQQPPRQHWHRRPKNRYPKSTVAFAPLLTSYPTILKLLMSNMNIEKNDKPVDDNDDDSSDLNCTDESIAQQQQQQQQQQTQIKPYRPLGPKLTSLSTMNIQKQLDDTLFRKLVQYLAELSLLDYQWRVNVFQQNEANRQMIDAMARIRFGNDFFTPTAATSATTTSTVSSSSSRNNKKKTNDSNSQPQRRQSSSQQQQSSSSSDVAAVAYLRPMDAPNPGPLGLWEQQTVSLLYDVFVEEQRRAQRIIAASGTLIRPSNNVEPTSTTATPPTTTIMITNQENRSPTKDIQSNTTSTTISPAQLGPLGRFEQQVVEFWTSIVREELLRIQTKTWRPKDVQPSSVRGPIGRLEYKVSTILEDITNSERIRNQQSKVRKDGSIVRPIDVPGPLGELELQVSEIVQEEFRRVQEKRRYLKNSTTATGNDLASSFTVLRPKDATFPGPLGIAEANAYATIQSVSNEEMERYRAIQRTLMEHRPMITNSNSILGILETIVVGICRAPQMLISVIVRVQELLSSTLLDETDVQLLQQQQMRQEEGEATASSTSKSEETIRSPPPPPEGEFL
jgi:hypothetical protein